jgi:hypothetical protein
MEFTAEQQQLHATPRKFVGVTMGKVRNLKRRADSILEEVFRSLFEDINTEKIQTEIEELKAAAPGYRPVRHARVLARRTALRCAAAGAVTGLPGGALAIGALGADLAYLLYQQFRLILGIAAIYGHAPTAGERFSEALSCLAYSSGVGVGKQGIATVLNSATVEGGAVAERIGARMARARLARIVPIVGAVSGGALNYVSVRAVASSAIRYYESLIDPVLADEIWAEGDREHA